MNEREKTRNRSFLKYLALFSLILPTFFIPHASSAANLRATCFADPLAAKVGQQVIWHVIPEGGSGLYQYSWSGDDDLFGNTSNISKIYDTDGTKEATVVVSSGGEIVTPTCEVEISEIDPTLSVSCFPQSSVINLSQEVEWNAEARGGNGKYQYSWSGDENLGGDRQGSRRKISKTYQTTGIKSATVIVSSLGQSSSRTCNVTIEPDPFLSGICYPNNMEVSVGESVVWTAEAHGGSGEYEYSWNGVDNERGLFNKKNKQAVSSVYNSPGEKTVSVFISSGSQTITETCSVNVGLVYGAQSQSSDYSGFSAICNAFPASTLIGEEITWQAQIFGGIGSYEYSWEGSENLESSKSEVHWFYDSPGIKSASLVVRSGDQVTSAFCSAEILSRDGEPLMGGVLGDSTQDGDTIPSTSIISRSWAIFFAFVMIMTAAIIFIIVSIVNKNRRKEKKKMAIAYDHENIDKAIAEIIQAQARKKKVLISVGALRLLIEETNHDVMAALRSLDQIIEEMPEELEPAASGEEKWPALDRNTVENFFLREKAGISQLTFFPK